jgi:hypothetical protein
MSHPAECHPFGPAKQHQDGPSRRPIRQLQRPALLDCRRDPVDQVGPAWHVERKPGHRLLFGDLAFGQGDRQVPGVRVQRDLSGAVGGEGSAAWHCSLPARNGSTRHPGCHGRTGGALASAGMTWQPPEEVQLAEEGLRRAIARLSADLDTATESPFFSVFEVLQWQYALHVWHHKHGLRGDRYLDARAGSPSGRTLGALVWARGVGLHRLIANTAEAELYPSTSLAPSVTRFPGNLWRWRPYQEVRGPGRGPARAASWSARKRRPDPVDDWYRQHAEQHAVLPPVEAAAAFLLDEIHAHY